MLCLRSFISFGVVVHSPHLVLTKSLVEDSIGVLLPVLEVPSHCILVVVKLDLLVDQLLELTSLQTVELEVEVKWRHGLLLNRLIGLSMQFSQEGMGKSVLN